MRLPKKIKVGPHVFAVAYDRTTCEVSGVVGACLEDQTTIILDDLQSASQQRETLLHESLHAVWSQTWMDLKYPDDAPGSEGEKMIRELASRLLGLLRDNPRMLAFLTGEDK